jgi:hypothetical protein
MLFPTSFDTAVADVLLTAADAAATAADRLATAADVVATNADAAATAADVLLTAADAAATAADLVATNADTIATAADAVATAADAAATAADVVTITGLIVKSAATSIAGGDGVGKVGDLNSSPVQILDAPAAGKAAIPIALQCEFTGDVAYDGAGAGNDIIVSYNGVGAALLFALDNGNGDAIRLVRNAAGTDYAWQEGNTNPAEVTPLPATAINISVTGADPYTAAGNIAMKVILFYRLIDCPMP